MNRLSAASTNNVQSKPSYSFVETTDTASIQSTEPRTSRWHAQRTHRLVGLVPTLCFVVLLIALLTLRDSSTTADGVQVGCDASGNIWVSTSGLSTTPSRWDLNYTLAITLAFGSLSYTAVRVIDEVWNLIIGRGSQLLGGVIVFSIFRAPIAEAFRTMSHPPYRTTLAMQYSTVSPASLWRYVVDIPGFMSRRVSPADRSAGRHAALAAVLLSISTSMVIMTPTWLSAMTGYQAMQVPVMPWKNDTYISLDNLSACVILIADGDRVGLSQNYCVGYDGDLFRDLKSYTASFGPLVPSPLDHLGCRVTHRYLGASYGLYGCPFWTSFHTSSNFTHNGHTYQLDNNTLSLSSLIVANDTSGNYIVSIDSNHDPVFIYDSDILTYNDLLQTGICQPQKTYQWGFSFLLLFVFLVTMIVLSLALYIYRCFECKASGREETTSVFGPFKTAIVVADRVRVDLGDGVQSMSENQIQEVLASRQGSLRTSSWLAEKRARLMRRPARRSG
ncbi:hypothetical protein B0A48_04945 [Cryoendolithus antarcticus]|uniref:Uncharacterized protein n=1 Tax=Cryoendolithus antarcticus TaxID=1507870 RepID=A0A1V8TDT8_9PEZI|nr:hypothetical protein B0A48_04945 [Cryoendolithus antarcticus]